MPLAAREIVKMFLPLKSCFMPLAAREVVMRLLPLRSC